MRLFRWQDWWPRAETCSRLCRGDRSACTNSSAGSRGGSSPASFCWSRSRSTGRRCPAARTPAAAWTTVHPLLIGRAQSTSKRKEKYVTDPVLRIRVFFSVPGPEFFPSRIRIFPIPDQNFIHPGSRILIKELLTQKIVSKLTEIWSGLFILDPDFLPIPDPEVKKAPDPGSGPATLYRSVGSYLYYY